MKRKVAIAFLGFVAILILGTVALLRTRWAGERVCALAAAKVREASGLELELGACRIDPLRFELRASSVRVGPAGAPVFSADAVRVRLAPLQALGRRIQLSEVAAVRPRLALSVPPRAPGEPPGACPPPLLSQFELHRLEVEEGRLDLVLPGGERVSSDRVDVHSAPAELPRRLRSLASASRTSRVVVKLGPTRIRAGGRETRIDSAAADADVALDLSRLAIRSSEIAGEGLRIEVRGQVTNLCSPVLALDVGAHAPLPALFALLGKPAVRSGGTAAAAVHLSGRPAAPEVQGRLELSGARIGVYAPGDARATFRLVGTDLDVQTLEVPFQGGSVTGRARLRLGREVLLTAEVETRQMEFAELLERLGLDGAYVMMRLTSQVKVSGTAWPLSLSGQAAVDIQDFRVLSHSWKEWKPGGATALDFRKGRLDAGVHVGPEAVQVADGKVSVGGETLGVSGALSLSDGFDLDFAGGVDLGELGHLAAIPLAGRASAKGTIRARSYGDPRIEGQLRATGFHFLQLDLGEVAAHLTYERLLLLVEELKGTKGGTRYQGEATVDLARSPAFLASSRLSAEGRLRDLFEAVMPWVPASRRVRDAIDAEVSVDASASGPTSRLDADFDARLGRGALFGRAFDSGEAKGRIAGGARALFERAELRRGPSLVRASGEMELGAPSGWDLEISFSGAQLAEMALPGGPWTGSASGTASLSGTMEEPSIRFAASGDGVSVSEIPVGSVQVGGNLFGDRLALTGTTPGVHFSGSARLAGDRPFEARADLDVEDVTRFIPGGPPAGLRAQVKGEATAEGSLLDLENSRARLKFAEFRGGYADFKVDAKEPILIAVDRGRVEVAPFTLRGANTEFALAGRRAGDGRLDFTAGGSLDLRLLGGLVPAVTRTHGQLSVDAHVTGTASEPLLVGAGRIRDAGFRVRELPLEFAAMNGDLAFSQNRVLFDDLAATLNAGRTQLRGEVELTRFIPSRLRVEADLDTVPMTIPSWIPSWISGRLAAFGSPDAMTLSGKLHVLRASYTQKVDLEKSLLEFRRRGTIARPYDKPGDWLRYDIQLLVDGDARVENDLVRGGVRGEVTVTGTLGSMGLLGSLTMTPGSRATFRGNEFTLSHAVMDFTERHRVRATLDVHGDAQVSDYQVYMHLFGPLDGPQLQLTSAPPLSQQDIITLLSLGFSPRDTAVRAGMAGAAQAAAAQALFSVSGLDDQLRRFLPREGLFKDLSVRITSAYSEATGQVEPRAEFESRVWQDRLRLRFQAPLSGTQRGQRAQAELKLGTHSSLQGQWENEVPDAGGDLGMDLKLRWEWAE